MISADYFGYFRVLFFVSVILVILTLVGSVSSEAVLENPLPDHTLELGERFFYQMPDDTFLSTDNTTLHYLVHSKNNWISRGLGDGHLKRSGLYFFQPRSIVVEGDYLFCADSYYGLRIFKINISRTTIQPYSSLNIIAEENGWFHDIQVQDSLVFLLHDKRGVFIINVFDKSQPHVISVVINLSWASINRANFFVSGKYAYFSEYDNGVRIIDISTPSSPVDVSLFENGGDVGIIEVDVNRDILYLCDNNNDDLLLLDISEKSTPRVVSKLSNSFNRRYYGLISFDDYVYVISKAISSLEYAYSIFIIDVRNTSNPQIVKEVNIIPSIGVFKKSSDGKLLFLNNYGNARYVVINIEYIINPYIIIEHRSDDIYNIIVDVFVYHNDTYLARINSAVGEIQIYSGTKISSPSQLLTNYKQFYNIYPPVPKSLAIRENYMYVAGYTNRKSSSTLQILDISDRLSPKPIYSGDLFLGSNNYISVESMYHGGEFLYVITSEYYFRIVDISFPDNILNPVELGKVNLPNDNDFTNDDLVVYEDYAYCLSANDMKIVIIDVKDPEYPVIVHTIEFEYNVFQVRVVDNYAYVATSRYGFCIFDVSDKQNPFLVGQLESYNRYGRIVHVLNDDIVYLLESTRFTIVNITMKTNPFVISDHQFSEGYFTPKDALVLKNRLYFTCSVGLYIYDISEPLNVVFEEFYYVNQRDGCENIIDGGGYLYLATSYAGISIFYGHSKQVTLSDDEFTTFSCGSVNVSIEAYDEGNSSHRVLDTFVLSRNYNPEDPYSLCRGHGNCYDNARCNCYNGWAGETCVFPVCFGIDSTRIHEVCSGNGKCTGPDTCECFGDKKVWTGSECQFHFCYGVASNNLSFVCNGHGSCVEKNKCSCDQGWRSSVDFGVCDLWYCFDIMFNDSQVCSSSGRCVSYNKCICDKFVNDEGENLYTGSSCETWYCGGYDRLDFTRACNGRGECQTKDDCKCSKSYYDGENCERNMLATYIFTPIGSVFGFSLLICCFVCICCVCLFFCIVMIALVVSCISTGMITGVSFTQRKKISQFERLDGFEVLLHEQLLEKDATLPHLKINKDLFEIPYDEVKIDCLIGEGGSGALVFKATWGGSEVAFKCFKTRRICVSQENFDMFERELNLLANINHPNVIRFFGASLKPPRVGIVMEYLENGEILDFISNYRVVSDGRGYPLKEKMRMIYEIATAVEYIHSRNIIHRDIKPGNVLIDSGESCRLMDFGISRIIKKQDEDGFKTKMVGTSPYMAPEILKGKYDEKCDVFSFGILMWVILSEKREPYERGGYQVEFRVANDLSFRPNLEALEKTFGECDDINRRNEEEKWIRTLISRCWDGRPERRLPFSELTKILSEKIEKIEKISPSLDNINSSSIIITEREREEKVIYHHQKNKKEDDVSNQLEREELLYLVTTLREENKKWKGGHIRLQEENERLREEIKRFRFLSSTKSRM